MRSVALHRTVSLTMTVANSVTSLSLIFRRFGLKDRKTVWLFSEPLCVHSLKGHSQVSGSRASLALLRATIKPPIFVFYALNQNVKIQGKALQRVIITWYWHYIRFQNDTLFTLWGLGESPLESFWVIQHFQSSGPTDCSRIFRPQCWCNYSNKDLLMHQSRR